LGFFGLFPLFSTQEKHPTFEPPKQPLAARPRIKEDKGCVCQDQRERERARTRESKTDSENARESKPERA